MPGKVWQVAGRLTKGRSKAHVVPQGPPGTLSVAYAEWNQATTEPNWLSRVPEVVRTLNAEMQAQLESNEVEFYELVTPDKLFERGNS